MRRVLAASAAAVFLLAGPALAHGELIEARPGPGDTVGGDVVEIELRFEEALESDGLSIVVTAPDGSAVAAETPRLVADVIARAEVAGISEPGAYRVEYRAVSFDGFVFEGAYLFTYDAAAPAQEPFPEGRTSAGTTILLALVGTALFAGGGWLLARRQARRIRSA